MSNQLKIGDVGIANEFDAPQSSMVVVVTKINKTRNIYNFRYLYAGMESKFNRQGVSEFADFTPLSDFGITLVINSNQTFRCQKSQESRACYFDGKPRRWQEHVEFDLQISRYFKVDENGEMSFSKPRRK